MKLPSYLDFAFLLAALPPREPEGGEPVVIDHEDFRLSLLAPAVPGMPFRPLGYFLLAWMGAEAVRHGTRELGSSVPKLCKALGTPELAENPTLIEDQLVRLAQLTVKVELPPGKKLTRIALFPLLSELVLDSEAPEAGYKWHVRISGDFYDILKHTAPVAIPKVKRLLTAETIAEETEIP
jgi:hypothetical protein